MTPDAYPIPKQQLCVSQEIKRSRFITYITHTPSVVESDEFLKEIRQQYADARHHCWARIVGAPDDSMSYGFSDDGEPSGTAGKPMLQQLLGSGIGELTTVVVRYFGGIKLGTGGLVRAYGSSVQQGLNELETALRIAMESFSVAVPFDLIGVLEHLIKQHNAVIESRDYANSVVCLVSCPKANTAVLIADLKSQGKGKIELPGIKNQS